MMASYVYPNVSGITQRGGLLERWQLAVSLGCDYVEIPADFVKNRSEMEKTGLKLGDFLTDQAIAKLYDRDYDVPKELKYILHTEPSLARRDGYGLSYQAPLKWYEKGWVTQIAEMVISISKFLGMPSTIIEIHSGDRRNSFEDIAVSIQLLLERYAKEFDFEPLILLENRTGQVVSSGREIQGFWAFLIEEHPQLERKVGIVLDVQQLYTVTKKKFLAELNMIPSEALKGFHIHHRHTVPDLSNEIPWRQVFGRIAALEHQIIINPEILHKSKVKDALEFCEKMLHG